MYQKKKKTHHAFPPSEEMSSIEMKMIVNPPSAAFRIEEEMVRVKVLPVRGHVTLSKSHTRWPGGTSRAHTSQDLGEAALRDAWRGT